MKEKQKEKRHESKREHKKVVRLAENTPRRIIRNARHAIGDLVTGDLKKLTETAIVSSMIRDGAQSKRHSSSSVSAFFANPTNLVAFHSN